MFTLKDIDPAIIYLDSQIKKYAVCFAKEKIDFDTQTQNDAFLSNERTISTYANSVISEYLTSNKYNVPLTVDEFSIKIANGMNPTLFKMLIEDVAKTDKDKPWKRCYVDGYFKIKDFIKPQTVFHMFVEYKMNNSFVYLDLATDYLKYKAITYVNDVNTAFVYIITKKMENYPSVLSTSSPHYEFLKKTINTSNVSGTKNVYIYIPNYGNVPTSTNAKPKDSSELEKAIKALNEVVTLTNKIDPIREETLKRIPENKLMFVKSMKQFNSRVAKSSTLRKHYPFIKKVFDSCNQRKSFINLGEIFYDIEGEITPKVIIDEGSKYKSYLSNALTIDAKEEMVRNGLRGATNVSLFIVSVLDYFNEKFEIGVPSPDYGTVTIGRGKNKREIKLQETVDFFKDKIEKNYWDNSEGDRRLKKISYSLMYYLVNLFETIYNIGDDLTVSEYNKDFTYYQILEKLQTLLDTAKRAVKYKDDIDVEEIMDSEVPEQSPVVLNFVNWIISHY